MYCFDTDLLSSLIARQPRMDVVRRLAVVPIEEQHTTSVNLAELLYGAARIESSSLVERIRQAILASLRVVPFDAPAAEIYGPLRARLEQEGRTLEENDLMIASVALARDLTLVTGNVRHFERVPGLRVENWLA